MDINSIQDLRVVDLKKELDIRGLPKSGSKKDLVDRLRSYIEQEEQQSQPTDLSKKEHGTEAPAIEEAGGNEIVKNYLEQRRQLLSQQMEQKKRYEEEASRSHSECEAEEQASSLDRRESGAVAVATEDSGDSTDVGSPPEQTTEPSEQMHRLEAVHAGDGDKSDVADAPEAAELLTKTSQSRSPSPPVVQKTELLEADGDKPPAVSEQKQQQRRNRSRSRSSESDRSRSKSEIHHERSRSRSSSASSKSDTQEQQRRSRSNSRSASRSSGEEGKVKGRSAPHSRSSSEEDRTQDTRSRSRSRSSSAERGKDVSMARDRSRSHSAESGREMTTEEQSRSRSPSVERPKSAAEAQVGSSASDRAVDQEGTAQLMDISVPVELAQPIDLMVDESQLSIDSRLDVASSTSEVTQAQTASTVVDSTVQAPEGDGVAVTKPVREVPDVSFTEAKPIRKRKWGSATIRELKTIDISTDSLKNLGLEISAEALAAELPMELSEPAPALNGDASSKEGDKQAAPQSQRTVLKSQDSVTGSDTRAPKIRRIVYKDDTIPTATTEDKDEKTVEEEQKVADGANEDSATQADATAKSVPGGEGDPAKVVRSTSVSLMVNDQAKVARSVSLTVEDPVDVGRRAPSPPRRAPSNVIHVTGLVRPYTLGQLKELLGRTGTLVADGFWIDNIKSHCYVTYETVEQAVATREALHGKRWPASNPKVLGVEFRTADEVEFRKTNKAPAGPGAAGPAAAATARPTKPLFEQAMAETRKEQDKNKLSREQPETAKVAGSRDMTKARPKDSKENAAPPQPPVREWDRHKLRQSRSKSKERRPRDDKPRVERERERDRKEPEGRGRTRSRDEKKSREKTDKPAGTKVEEEPPAKLLDDLFRKTKAIPCIYWLPLTDEQVAVRLAEEKERQAMKEKRRMEREQQLEAERQQRLKARDERDKERGRESDRGGARPQRKFSEENVSRRRRS